MSDRSTARAVLAGASRALVAALAVGSTVVVVAALGIAAVGRWWDPNGGAPGAATGADAAAVAEDDTPAHSVLAAVAAADGHVLGSDDLRTGTRTTTRHRDLDRCDTTASALGAEYTLQSLDGSEAVVSVEVVGAGLGGRSLLARTFSAHHCGAAVAATTGPGVAAVEGVQAGRWWLMWRRGDVVVRVVGAPETAPDVRNRAEAIDAALARELEGVCLDQAAPIDVARRNPGQPDHQPLSVTEPVTPPTDATPPDPGLLTRGQPRPDAASMRAAAGLAAAPAPPSLPEAGTVDVPVADPDGPGCGWAFTGMTDLGPDTTTVADLAEQIRADATDALRARWDAWPGEVEDWQRLLAAYRAVQRRRPDVPSPSPTTAPPEPDPTSTSTTGPTPTPTAPPTTEAPPPTTAPPTTTTVPVTSPPTTTAPGGGQTGSTVTDGSG